jgi:hypothetical protein
MRVRGKGRRLLILRFLFWDVGCRNAPFKLDSKVRSLELSCYDTRFPLLGTIVSGVEVHGKAYEGHT